MIPKAMKILSVCFFVGLSFFLTAGSPTTESKISPWLLKQYETRKKQEELPNALIYLKSEADLSHINKQVDRTQRLRAIFNTLVKTAQSSQSDLLVWLHSHNVKTRSYYISNMIVAEQISMELLTEIAQREDVLRVVGNPQIEQQLPQTMRESSDEQPKGPGANLVRIGATKVWEDFKVKGENIIVAGQDTGVSWNHVALKTHYRGWEGSQVNHAYSWHDSVHKNVGGNSSCGYDVTVPCDDHSHGTHTLGTVVGDDNLGNQIGVAPAAKWIACRNMDSGIGNPEMYTECFQWFLAPWPQNGDPIQDAKPELAAHVINNSWGCPKSEGCDGGEFERILKALKTAGIFVVASAGNNGSSCSSIDAGPAFHSDLVLSVGAVNHRSDTIAGFSSRGPSTYDNKIGPHVTAPGVDVRSAVPTGGYAEYGWSGTSRAGPHLVGVVALLWSADPSLIGNIEETERIIKQTAEPKTSTQTCGGVGGSAIPNNTFGYGIANVYEAVKYRLEPK
jgi:subtilisin family serine protease